MSRVLRGAACIAIGGSLLVALAGPAMAGDVAPSTGSSAAAPRSPVGDWRTRTDGVLQTITFAADGTVSGSAGCNRFAGTYSTDGSAISIGPLATTLMACEENIMNAEATFLVRLQAAVSYKATAKTLKVFAPKDMIPFRRA
ncbi:MAG: META domain-containing protein [Actinomycetota bacterium]|nr:META domain-containing protein [Actinomycetota bacterium]